MSDRAIAGIKELLVTKTLPALGPTTRPDALSAEQLRAKLDALFAESDFAPQNQELIRALLLLWHDHLDASHQISQGIENADGSFIHAIMHRREPDYWNSKYWWRRVGKHAAFPELAQRTEQLLQSRNATRLTAKLISNGYWDACAFVDLCEQAIGDNHLATLLQEIQRLETEVLLESFLCR